MKVAYLCSSDISNHLFIETFKKHNLELLIYIENNKHNRKKIAKKKFNKLSLIEKIISPLDLLSLVFYKNIIRRFLKNKLNLISFAKSKENLLFTQDINSSDVYKNINSFKPDVIIVRGTSVIKEPLINYHPKYFLNIHGAIVPNYRNVHGQFWSYYFKDFQNMGSSVLHLTKGIDNGNIALISNLDETPSSLKDLHLKTLVLSNNLTDKLIRNLLIENKLDSDTQNKNVKPFYGQTPRFIDFIKLWI
mgnify:CR=1 FL=1